MGWRLHVLLLATALLMGCPTSSERDAPTMDAPVLNEEVLAALIAVEDARCARAVRCLPERDAAFLRIVCRAPEEIRDEALATAIAPGASVDRAALERCLTDGLGDCNDHLYVDWYGRCATVVTFPPPCRSCPDGLVCARPEERCAAFTCLPPPGLGDRCSEVDVCAAPYECIGGRCIECDADEDCGSERYCDDLERRCRARGELGGACDWRAPCLTGLVCDATSCRVAGSRGEPCLASAGCAAELACIDGVCADPLPDGAPCTGDCAREGVLCLDGRCLRLGGVGEPCGELFGRSLEADPQGSCASPLRCADGVCRETREGDPCGLVRTACGGAAPRCDEATRTCIPDARRGPCDPSCPAGEVCELSSWLCVATAAPGEACGNHHVCQGGVCEDGVCVRTVIPSEPCGPDRRCPLGWSCEAGACARLPDVGAPCAGECLHGVCTDGTCTWLAPGDACGDALDPCELGCQHGVCAYLQTEVGGPCFQGTFGRCADGLDCAPDASYRYRCVEACPE